MWDDNIASRDLEQWLNVDFRAFENSESPSASYPPSAALSSIDDRSAAYDHLPLLDDRNHQQTSPVGLASLMNLANQQAAHGGYPMSRHPSQTQQRIPQFARDSQQLPPPVSTHQFARDSQQLPPPVSSRLEGADISALTAQLLLRAQQQVPPPALPGADPASLSMLLGLMNAQQTPVAPAPPAPVSDLASAALQLVAAAGNSNAFSLLSTHLLAASSNLAASTEAAQQPQSSPASKKAPPKKSASPASRTSAATPAAGDDEDDDGITGGPEVYYNKDGKEMTAEEADKRRRNTAASARFRAKKKQREQEIARTAKDMSQRVETLEKRLVEYEMEIRWLRQLVTERNGKRLRDVYEENGLVLRDGTEAAGSSASDIPVAATTGPITSSFKAVAPTNSALSASAKFLQSLNLDPEIAKQVLMAAAAQASNVQRPAAAVSDELTQANKRVKLA